MQRRLVQLVFRNHEGQEGFELAFVDPWRLLQGFLDKPAHEETLSELAARHR